MDTSVINNIVVESFSSITLIDIINDKVSLLSFDGSAFQETSSNTYEQYFENAKKVIHPDFLNKYFEAISLNNLEQKKSISIRYLKLSSNLAYENYYDIIRLVEDNKVLVFSMKDTENNGEEKVKNADDEIYINLAGTIINIENVLEKMKLDNYEFISFKKYLLEVLNDLKKNKNVLNKYQAKVINSVNKINDSLLIVDDDSLTRNIFKKIFSEMFNIIEAKNGMEAVDILKNPEHMQNIVGMFLDLKMPIMDGFGVLDFLNQQGIIKRIPVIIISADDAKETKEEVYSYEIADMLEKPFNYELIKKRVSNIISMYEKSNALNDLINNQDRDLKNIIRNYTNAYLVDHENVNKKAAEYLKILLETSKENDSELIMEALKYYDLGLNLIPRTYLSNVNALGTSEKNLFISYPNMGTSVLKYLGIDNLKLENYASKIILMRNERYDGLGFPNKIKENNIPMYIYLVNMALELSSYQNIKNFDAAASLIVGKKLTKYHPKAIEIFESAKESLRGLYV